ncbi:hypothetical protein GCM10009122_45630 [Fulvivirga kasyanovii]|uniref:Aspartyl protease n=1 Tax=Fulvivirga kasyanovii TaxID=396812 RepID=A0ABW9RJK8_9BACT|nr:hypothetical protein [Fulvivirga kasyanovii]MTI24264.1 hypothetical protein [Fulvivirga kasyanovii]
MNNTTKNKPGTGLRRYVCTCAFLVFTSFAFAANPGFNFINNKQQTTIRFKLIENLVVIPVTVNNDLKVNLVLDTGGRSLILFGEGYGKLLSVLPDKEVRLNGYGHREYRPGKLSPDNKICVSDIQGLGIGIVVTNDRNFFPYVDGTSINGIIGYQIFSRFIVKIDYPNRLITLTEPFVRPPIDEGFSAAELIIKDTKPYIKARLGIGEVERDAFLHVDTGSSREMILFLKEGDGQLESSKGYRCHVGRGLNGNIQGYKGKDLRLIMPGKNFDDVESFLLKREFSNRELQDASGTIGSGFLQDFVIVLDYINQKFYYKHVAV